jgi:hypothetical protein
MAASFTKSDVSSRQKENSMQGEAQREMSILQLLQKLQVGFLSAPMRLLSCWLNGLCAIYIYIYIYIYIRVLFFVRFWRTVDNEQSLDRSWLFICKLAFSSVHEFAMNK